MSKSASNIHDLTQCLIDSMAQSSLYTLVLRTIKPSVYKSDILLTSEVLVHGLMPCFIVSDLIKSTMSFVMTWLVECVDENSQHFFEVQP